LQYNLLVSHSHMTFNLYPELLQKSFTYHHFLCLSCFFAIRCIWRWQLLFCLCISRATRDAPISWLLIITWARMWPITKWCVTYCYADQPKQCTGIRGLKRLPILDILRCILVFGLKMKCVIWENCGAIKVFLCLFEHPDPPIIATVCEPMWIYWLLSVCGVWWKITYSVFRAGCVSMFRLVQKLRKWLEGSCSDFHHYQFFSKQCRLALLPATECISQPMTMTVTGSNSMSTTGRPKGMYMPSQTPPLLPKVRIHT